MFRNPFSLPQRSVTWPVALLLLIFPLIGSVQAAPMPQRDAVAERRTAVEQILAEPIGPQEISRLIAIDSELDSDRSPAARELQRRILLALGETKNPAVLPHLRAVFERTADRRNAAAVALSRSGTTELADWRFLVRSLTVVEGADAVSVLTALRRFPQRATKPIWLRRVYLLGLRLEQEQRPLVIDLLEHWSGGRFDAGEREPAAALDAFADWYRETYPNEPTPVPPTDSPTHRWKYAELLPKLTASDADGDPTRGLAVYRAANCHKCHVKGEIGERFGPDLTTLGWRRQRKEILSAILFPSHELDEDYQTSTIVTDSGRVLNGVMLAGPDGKLIVMSSDGTRRELDRSEIELVRPSNVSTMPNNLLEPLSLREIRDLFAFLTEMDPNANRGTPHHVDRTEMP